MNLYVAAALVAAGVALTGGAYFMGRDAGKDAEAVACAERLDAVVEAMREASDAEKARQAQAYREALAQSRELARQVLETGERNEDLRRELDRERTQDLIDGEYCGTVDGVRRYNRAVTGSGR